MDDYMAKPVTLNDLERALSRSKDQLDRTRDDAGDSPTPQEDENIDTPDVDVDPDLDEERLTQLADILGGGEDGLPELIETYASSTPPTLDRIREAAQADDMESLSSAAHKLKGESVTVGARALAEACKTLELDAREGEVDDLEARLERIGALHERTVAALRDFRPG